MKIDELTPARTFCVGGNGEITITHVADVYLEPDEQITLKTTSGTEFDIARKSFGYYATPSLNNRLVEFNLKTALVRGRRSGRTYVLMCEFGKEDEMQAYCDWDDLRIVCWLNDDNHLDRIEATFPESEYTRTDGISKHTIHEPSQSLSWLRQLVNADWCASLITSLRPDADTSSPTLLMTDCGDDGFLPELSAALPQWICAGSSPYEVKLQQLRKNAAHIKCINDHLFNVAGQFDVVLSLEGLPRARETQPVLDKLTSLLSPTGILLALGFVNDEDTDIYTEIRSPKGRWKTGLNGISRSGIERHFKDKKMAVTFHPIPLSKSSIDSMRANNYMRVVFDSSQNSLLCTKSGLIIEPVFIEIKPA